MFVEEKTKEVLLTDASKSLSVSIIDDVAAKIEQEIISCFANHRKEMVSKSVPTIVENSNIDEIVAQSKIAITYDDILQKECKNIIDGFRFRIGNLKHGKKPSEKKIIVKRSNKKSCRFHVTEDHLVASTFYHNNYIPLKIVNEVFDFAKSLDFIQVNPLLEAFQKSKKTSKDVRYRESVVPKISKHHAFYCLTFFKKFGLMKKDAKTGYYKVKKLTKDMNDVFEKIKL